jgi:hypothetical protein
MESDKNKQLAESAVRRELMDEPEAKPFFRNEGGEEAAQLAQREMEAIMVDYLALSAVVDGPSRDTGA